MAGITSLVCTLALPIRVMQGSLQSIFQHSCWAFGKNLGENPPQTNKCPPKMSKSPIFIPMHRPLPSTTIHYHPLPSTGVTIQGDRHSETLTSLYSQPPSRLPSASSGSPDSAHKAPPEPTSEADISWRPLEALPESWSFSWAFWGMSCEKRPIGIYHKQEIAIRKKTVNIGYIPNICIIMYIYIYILTI